jgi:hypothetical protein
VLELIGRGSPLPKILDLLLSVIQAQCPGMLCSILLLRPDGIHVRHRAARGLPEAFIRGVDGEPIVGALPQAFPLTSDFSAWYASMTIFAVAAVLALAAWSFRIALGARKLWREGFLDA